MLYLKRTAPELWCKQFYRAVSEQLPWVCTALTFLLSITIRCSYFIIYFFSFSLLCIRNTFHMMHKCVRLYIAEQNTPRASTEYTVHWNEGHIFSNAVKWKRDFLFASYTQIIDYITFSVCFALYTSLHFIESIVYTVLLIYVSHG